MYDDPEVSLMLTNEQAQKLLTTLESKTSEDLGCLVPVLEMLQQDVSMVYNPDFGDDRDCACGHCYELHFDTHDNMRPVGCKYCECGTWHGIETKSVDVKTMPHQFSDSWDDFDGGKPGLCSYPFCSLRPEQHLEHRAHVCEDHPLRKGFCRECGRSTE